jgi:TolB protein
MLELRLIRWRMIGTLCAAVLALTTAQPAGDGAKPAPPTDWRAEETLLTDHVQLTFPERFIKAGEAYFDHEQPPRWIVFQGVERPEAGKEPSPHYAMYVARLRWEGERIAGLEKIERISPEGAANTCGWFSPLKPGQVLFGSTMVAPKGEGVPGFQRGTSRYRWDFPPEMRVVWLPVASIIQDVQSKEVADAVRVMNGGVAQELFTPPPGTDGKPMDGYIAECSWSPDGRHIVYTHVDQATSDPEIWVYDTRLRADPARAHIKVVGAKGYDGGPFFSPDGRWLCWRSDRQGDNNLQLFIGELAFGDKSDAGRITGLAREVQLTSDEGVVNWAPFWHPGGQWLVYASSQVSHRNYEVFAIDARPAMQTPAQPQRAARARITHADGFDGLPAFSADGRWLLITSQRAGAQAELLPNARPSSQLWVARVNGEPAWIQPASAKPAEVAK